MFDPRELVGHLLDGQVRIDAWIGDGGFSSVYRGVHLGLQEEVAIKCFRLPEGAPPELVRQFTDRFRDESRIAYRLSQGHLHIVRCLTNGTHVRTSGGAIPYMVLEWLSGNSLATDLASRRAAGQGGRGPEETLRLFAGALEAIAYAHAQGVIHRDLKPGNLFLATGRDGVLRLKVLDFGYAKVTSDAAVGLSPLAASVGNVAAFSPAYAAPEQFDTRFGAVSAATDVYSIALVVLEVISGARVRRGDTLTECLLEACTTTEAIAPANLGIRLAPQVDLAFQRALHPKADQRWHNVGEFWNAIRSAMAEPKDGDLPDLDESWPGDDGQETLVADTSAMFREDAATNVPTVPPGGTPHRGFAPQPLPPAPQAQPMPPFAPAQPQPPSAAQGAPKPLTPAIPSPLGVGLPGVAPGSAARIPNVAPAAGAAPRTMGGPPGFAPAPFPPPNQPAKGPPPAAHLEPPPDSSDLDTTRVRGDGDALQQTVTGVRRDDLPPAVQTFLGESAKKGGGDLKKTAFGLGPAPKLGPKPEPMVLTPPGPPIVQGPMPQGGLPLPPGLGGGGSLQPPAQRPYGAAAPAPPAPEDEHLRNSDPPTLADAMSGDVRAALLEAQARIAAMSAGGPRPDASQSDGPVNPLGSTVAMGQQSPVAHLPLPGNEPYKGPSGTLAMLGNDARAAMAAMDDALPPVADPSRLPQIPSGGLPPSGTFPGSSASGAQRPPGTGPQQVFGPPPHAHQGFAPQQAPGGFPAPGGAPGYPAPGAPFGAPQPGAHGFAGPQGAPQNELPTGGYPARGLPNRGQESADYDSTMASPASALATGPRAALPEPPQVGSPPFAAAEGAPQGGIKKPALTQTQLLILVAGGIGLVVLTLGLITVFLLVGRGENKSTKGGPQASASSVAVETVKPPEPPKPVETAPVASVAPPEPVEPPKAEEPIATVAKPVETAVPKPVETVPKPIETPVATAKSTATGAATQAVPPPAGFNATAARAAIDSQAKPSFAACKLKLDGPGGSGKVSVSFGADGKVADAVVSGPIAGTPAGDCIASRIKRVSLTPPPPVPGSVQYPYELKK